MHKTNFTYFLILFKTTTGKNSGYILPGVYKESILNDRSSISLNTSMGSHKLIGELSDSAPAISARNLQESWQSTNERLKVKTRNIYNMQSIIYTKLIIFKIIYIYSRLRVAPSLTTLVEVISPLMLIVTTSEYGSVSLRSWLSISKVAVNVFLPNLILI